MSHLSGASAKKHPLSKVIKALVALFIISSASAASAWDVSLDFSATQNPNGVWSYGYSTTLGGTMTRYTDHGTYSGSTVDYWRYDLWAGAPAVEHNSGVDTISIWTPGQVSLHPGPGGQFSTIRFTAPSGGQYQVSAAFRGLNPAPTTTDVHILDNGVSLFNANINSYLTPEVGPGTLVLNLQAGDRIDFAVGFGSNGNLISDTTGLSAHIVLVPEPSVTALTGISAAVLLGANRRRAYCHRNRFLTA